MGDKIKELQSVEKKPADTCSPQAVVLDEQLCVEAEETSLYSAPIKIGMSGSSEIPPNNLSCFQKAYGNISTLRHFSPAIQPIFKNGRPNDQYDKEADTIADQATSIPDAAIQRKPG